MARSIKLFIFAQVPIFISAFFDTAVFANLEVAFLSSFFVIVATSMRYKKLVQTRVAANVGINERDPLDAIDDPHELFEENEEQESIDDPKELFQKEKAKIKPFRLTHIREGLQGSLSLWRLGAYVLLALGFIALENNAMLQLGYYLVALFYGIVIANVIVRKAVNG